MYAESNVRRPAAGVLGETPYIAQRLAQTLAAIQDVPAVAADAARRCILDAVSGAIAGHATPGGKAARDGALVTWGHGSVPIWFGSARSTESGAAFANSVATCILDADDGYRPASGHPGAAIIPAVLAAVHDNPSLAPRAITAVAIGYEVGCRIGASRDLRKIETVISGRWCGQGVAAAVGWLKGMPAQVIAEAIAAAGSVAPLMEVADFTEVGNHVKEAIPHATANGILSLNLAKAGFRAPLDVLDESRFFNPTTLLDGLGERWLIESIYFKPYTCCRWIHAPLDGLARIMRENGLGHADLEDIRVATFANALKLNNQVEPKSLEAAQFSIPFCLGVLAKHGAEALLPMTNPALLTDRDVVHVASLVDVELDSRMDSYFPSEVPSRITVSTKDATYEGEVMAPYGSTANPMGWDALFDKFHSLAASVLGNHQEANLRDALDQMREGDLVPLLLELTRGVVGPRRHL